MRHFPAGGSMVSGTVSLAPPERACPSVVAGSTRRRSMAAEGTREERMAGIK
jgi:hypothetical protein